MPKERAAMKCPASWMRITNAKTVSEPRGEVMEESAVAGNADRDNREHGVDSM
jgi:hypothetical protein